MQPPQLAARVPESAFDGRIRLQAPPLTRSSCTIPVGAPVENRPHAAIARSHHASALAHAEVENRHEKEFPAACAKSAAGRFDLRRRSCVGSRMHINDGRSRSGRDQRESGRRDGRVGENWRAGAPEARTGPDGRAGWRKRGLRKQCGLLRREPSLPGWRQLQPELAPHQMLPWR